MPCPIGRGLRCLTSIYSRDDAFDNHDWQLIKPSQGIDDLPKGRQLRHHVQEQRDQGQEAEVQHCHGSVALSRPLSQDESLGTLAANDGPKGSKDEQGQR
jgi:hypothetical protein